MESTAKIGNARHEAFLLVGDDALFASAVARSLGLLGTVSTAASVASALATKAPSGRWTAVFLEVYLPDGPGFAVVDGLRARGDDTFAFLMSSEAGPALINRVFDADRVEIVAKPMAPERLERCVAKAKSRAPLTQRFCNVVRNWQVRYGLTRKEADIVRDALLGMTCVELSLAHAIAEGTVKKHVHNALQKLGAPTQRAMLKRAIDEADAAEL